MTPPAALRLLLPWSGRDLLRQRLIAIASVVAVMLGVAVFVSIRLANQSAGASFEAALGLITGQSDLEISAAAETLPDSLWAEFDQIDGVAAATPMVTGQVLLPHHDSVLLRLEGIDPFTAAPFFAKGSELVSSGDALTWLSWPASIWIDARIAERLELSQGDQLTLRVAGVDHRVHIGGLVSPQDSSAPANRAWCDIGWAQQILGKVGELDSIQVKAEDPDSLEALAQRIEASPDFPAAASAVPPQQRTERLRSLFEGYQLNLTALALVSLLVGSFLIYGTLAATVARRGKEIAVLRALGTTRQTIIALVLGQALVLGLVGTLLGLPLGVLAGKGVLELIREGQLTRLVAEASADYQVRPGELFLAAFIGLGATLAGGLLPALESLRHKPIHALHPHRASGTRRRSSKLPLILGGIALVLTIACGVAALSTNAPWLSFFACLFLIVAVTLLIPLGSRVISLAIAPLTHLFVLADLARRNFLRSQPRATLIMAGLITALAMVGGVEIMIHSFRQSVDNWISSGLQADYFITSLEDDRAESTRLPETLLEQAAATAGVAAVESHSQARVETSSGNRYLLNAIDSPGQRHEFAIIRAKKDALKRFYAGEAVLASEAFATAEGLAPGDLVRLKSSSGLVELPLAAVLLDYSDDIGRLYLQRKAYTAHWPDPGINSLAIYLKSNADRQAVRYAIDPLASMAGAELWDRKTLRERVLAVFDSTFRVTYALRAISILVAVIGAFALITIQLRERASEIAGLRSQGASSSQIFRLHLWEGGMLGLVTGILGTLCGIGLALLLTWVVMKSFFGWTVQFSIPPALLLALPLGMIICVLVAVLEPSWRSSRAPIIRALREE